MKPRKYHDYNYDISLLQFLFCKNTVILKEQVAVRRLQVGFYLQPPWWLQLFFYIRKGPLIESVAVAGNVN